MAHTKRPLKADARTLALAASGELNLRTRLGKITKQFADEVRASYGDSWNAPQEWRLRAGTPAFMILLTTEPLDGDGKVSAEWKKAHHRVVQLLQDLNVMASGRPRSFAKIEAAKKNDELFRAFGFGGED